MVGDVAQRRTSLGLAPAPNLIEEGWWLRMEDNFMQWVCCDELHVGIKWCLLTPPNHRNLRVTEIYAYIKQEHTKQTRDDVTI